MMTKFADRVDALTVACVSSVGRGSGVEPKIFGGKFISRGFGLINVCDLDGKSGKGEGSRVYAMCLRTATKSIVRSSSTCSIPVRSSMITCTRDPCMYFRTHGHYSEVYIRYIN